MKNSKMSELQKWNKFYLFMGIMFLSYAVFLISSSFYFKANINNINYAAAIDEAKTSQDIKQIREFLIHNLEYQQDLEAHRIDIYLNSGLMLFISSLFILGASYKKPIKSSNFTGRLP
jgi:hypothetical protein